MVQWIAQIDSWFNTRLVCWECNETTWKENEYVSGGGGPTPMIRWWTCKDCMGMLI